MAKKLVNPYLYVINKEMNLLNPYILGNNPDSFIMEVNCSQITLPLRSGFTYNFDVDYGDGTLLHVSSYNDANASHTYSGSGTYKIKITGTCQTIYFNNGSERLKLTKILQWGNVGFINFENSFFGCSNLLSIPNTPITGAENCVSFNTTFSNCALLTGLLPSGLFSNCPLVTTFYLTFANCTSLLGSLPSGLFSNCPLVTTYYRTFVSCRNLILNLNIFDLTKLNIVTSFQQTFYRASTIYSDTGTAPDIWNYATHPSLVKTQCFYNETALTNYADIPATWK